MLPLQLHHIKDTRRNMKSLGELQHELVSAHVQLSAQSSLNRPTLQASCTSGVSRMFACKQALRSYGSKFWYAASSAAPRINQKDPRLRPV